MSIKELVVGAVLTVVVGGTAYTISQADVAKNLAEETGMSQSEAEKYVKDAEGDLISWDELGADHVEYGNSILSDVKTIDCVNYEYEWESALLSCESGKTQLLRIGNSLVKLGGSYTALSKESSGMAQVRTAISDIDAFSSALQTQIVTAVLTPAEVQEMTNANAYNKSVLRAVLDKN